MKSLLSLLADYLNIFLAAALLTMGGCKIAVVSTNDSEPPRITLSAVQSLNKVRSVAGSSQNTDDISFDVAKGEDVFLLASSMDSNGVKSTTIKAISGGQIEISVDGEPSIVTEHVFTQEVNDGNVRNPFVVIATCNFDSPNGNMIIQAETEDFAGNRSTSPRIILTQKDKVTARLTYNIHRGETSDYVSLRWHVENGETARIETPLSAIPREVSPYATGGEIGFAIWRNSYATLIAENSVSMASHKIEISYTEPNAPEIQNFSIVPSTIAEGDSSLISWNVSAGGPVIVNIEPGVYDGLDNEGSVSLTPIATQDYTLTAIASGMRTVETRRINVLPPCWQTPNTNIIGGSFDYGNFFNGLHNYLMQLGDYAVPNDYVISSVKNKNSSTVRLTADGRSIDLRPNESSTVFNGLNISRGWILESPDRITFPAIEFCFGN